MAFVESRTGPVRGWEAEGSENGVSVEWISIWGAETFWKRTVEIVVKVLNATTIYAGNPAAMIQLSVFLNMKRNGEDRGESGESGR